MVFFFTRSLLLVSYRFYIVHDHDLVHDHSHNGKQGEKRYADQKQCDAHDIDTLR